MINNLKIYNGCKKSKKFGLKRAVAIASAFFTLFTLTSCSKKNQKEHEDTTQELTSDIFQNFDIHTRKIWDLGIELPMASQKEINKQRFGSVVSGNFNVSEVVVGSDGNVYVNSDAAEKAGNTSKTTIDDKNGTLNTSGSRVTEKEEGYVVRDSNGNTVSSGNGSTPDGYVYDDGQDAYVKQEDTGYVYADNNYYDKETGELIIAKGDLVSKETLERAKKMLTTVKPEKKSSNDITTSKESSTNSSVSEQPTSSSSNHEVTNNYYTAPDGSVWSSEAAYKSYLAGQNNTNTDNEEWYEVDGQLMNQEEFDAYQRTLTR